jgi:hypothetical protein
MVSIFLQVRTSIAAFGILWSALSGADAVGANFIIFANFFTFSAIFAIGQQFYTVRTLEHIFRAITPTFAIVAKFFVLIAGMAAFTAVFAIYEQISAHFTTLCLFCCANRNTLSTFTDFTFFTGIAAHSTILLIGHQIGASIGAFGHIHRADAICWQRTAIGGTWHSVCATADMGDKPHPDHQAHRQPSGVDAHIEWRGHKCWRCVIV